MTKEELIKEAWGALYESVKNSLNHTSGEFLIESCFFYEDDFYKKELFDTEVYNESLLIIRPKSLQGIEDNNGWIEIESEDDLPKEGDLFWVIKKGYDYPLFEPMYHDDGEYWLQWYTHYKPIEEPKPPLY